MFVCWKSRKLQPHNDRSDAECVHDGPDRWSWTPIVAESVWTPAGSRRRTVLRPSPTIRSCCIQDAFVRVEWWNATAAKLELAMNERLGINLELIMSKLAERVPVPTDEDLLIHDFWPADTSWWHSYGYEAASHREDVARIARRLAVDQLRPGDGDWADALDAWQQAETAYVRGAWDEYVHWETAGLNSVGQAISKARTRTTTATASEHEWLRAFQEHVRRLDERRARREDEARRRSEEERRRREREAAEERRRAADEARRRSHARTRPSAGPRSIVDRMNNGSPRDWAELLGLTYPCTREVLKRAYRDAVMRHHPDRSGDTETMKAVNIAKDRLERELQWYWATSAVN